jgi:hypothetical protein
MKKLTYISRYMDSSTTSEVKARKMAQLRTTWYSLKSKTHKK